MVESLRLQVRASYGLGRLAVGRAHLRQASSHAQVSHGRRSGTARLLDIVTGSLDSSVHHRKGIPTIHYRWLLHSAEQGTLLPYRPYLLPAGVSLVDDKRIVQYVLPLPRSLILHTAAVTRDSCSDESWPLSVFEGVRITLLGSHQFKVGSTSMRGACSSVSLLTAACVMQKYWRLVLEEAGAEVVGSEQETAADAKKEPGKRTKGPHAVRTPIHLTCSVAENESYLANLPKTTTSKDQTRSTTNRDPEEKEGEKVSLKKLIEERKRTAAGGDVGTTSDHNDDEDEDEEGRQEPLLCTIEWIVQSLICRHCLDVDSHRLFRYRLVTL